MSKPQPQRTPEELFKEATDGTNLSSGDLRLLTAGLVALRKANEKPVNNIEFNALCGMIAYVAFTQNVNEDTVSQILLAKFQAEEVRKMPSSCFQAALEYLVDLDVGKTVN